MKFREGGTAGEGVVILAPDGGQHGAAAFTEEGNLQANGGAKHRQQGRAAIEQIGGAIDLEPQQSAEIVVALAGSDLFFTDAEAVHGVAGNVNAIAFEDVAANILPEIGQLQGGAGAVGQLLASASR